MKERSVLVFGATGQQGGSVATALLHAGWQVRALVRNPVSAKSIALEDAGVKLIQGSFADTEAMRIAMTGIHAVFSVQPSSGQGPLLGLTDEEEEKYGRAIADMAVKCGVHHLVYTSTNAVAEGPTGMGHFDSKLRIETYIRQLPILSTIVRPAAFMEMLLMPGFGLDEGRFNFFMKRDQPMQFIAVADIGKIVATVLADEDRFGGKTFEIAGDAVTGAELEAHFSDAAGYAIEYSRFSDGVLSENPFLLQLTELLNSGKLAGRADLDELKNMNPDLQTFRSWIGNSGHQSFRRSLSAQGTWEYGRK